MSPELIVTPVMADRVLERDPDDDPIGLAMLNLVHRMACEAAQLHRLQHPRSVEFMEAETGRKGWRAYMSAETALAVEALEADGLCRFVHVDDA